MYKTFSKNSPAYIDEDNLHKEWYEHPRKVEYWRKKLNRMRARLDVAKMEKEYVDAEAEFDVRRRPERYGVEDVKEAAIKAAIRRHPKSKKAQKRVLKLTRIVGDIDATVQAMEHRKRALEKLVDLHIAGYFSTPSDRSGRMAEYGVSKRRKGRKK